MVLGNATKEERGESVSYGYETYEVFPNWCLRDKRDCRACVISGKIPCAPRFRVGMRRELAPRQKVIALLKERKRPLEVHNATGVPLPTIYSIGQQLRLRGELQPIIAPHPDEQKKQIIAYVKEHLNEQYKDIAVKYGVECSYISRLCSKAGIHRREHLRDERMAKVNQAIHLLTSEPHRSIASVAEKFGMAPTTLNYYIKRKGVLPIHHEARVFLEDVRKTVLSAVLEAFSTLQKRGVDVTPLDAEVLVALTSMGFSVREASKAVATLPQGNENSLEEKVKLALKYFEK